MKKKIFSIIFIFLVFCSRIYADEDFLSKLEKGDPISVNAVDPSLLTKTYEHYINNYIEERSKDEEYPLTEEELDDFKFYYRPNVIASDTLSAYVTQQLKEYNVDAYVYDCDTEYNCIVQTNEYDGAFPSGEEKIYNIKFIFTGEYDSGIEDEMIEFFTKIEKYYTEDEKNSLRETELNGGYTFVLEDMRMIDYLYNMSYHDLSDAFLRGNAVNYTANIRNITNSNFNLYIKQSAGDLLPFAEGYGGSLLFTYKNNAYFGAPFEGLMNYRYVVYIGEDTADTTMDYINAAKKRINDYYGKDVVDIKYNKPIENIYIERFCDSMETDGDHEGYLSCVDEANMFLTEEYGKLNMINASYIFTINGKEYPFLIAKDNNKIEYPEGIKSIDYETNVIIEGNNSEIPLDSKIEVYSYGEDTQKYNEYKTKFGKDLYYVVDINLFSINANKYITNLSKGNFNVKVPYNSAYDGRQLSAFYIRNDGTKEEHKLVRCGDYLCFDTNHFSVYSISESQGDITVPNPKITITKGNNNSLTININDQIDTDTYIIYRSTDKKKYTKIATINENTYTNTGLTYGKTYYYKVRAYNSSEKIYSKSYSNVVYKKVIPNTVTNLKYESISASAVKMSYDKVSASGYEVYRSTNNKTWSKVSTITKNSTLTYTNKKLSTNKTYYYRVRAYKTVSGKKVYGYFSNVIKIKTAPTKAKMSISLRDYNAFNVKVSSISGATYYKLYKSLDNKTWTLEDFNTSGSYVDNNLIFGKTYYYKVRACNSYNACGSYSSTVKLKLTTKTPSFSLTTTSKKINIKVNPVNNATGYEIYRATSKSGKYTKLTEPNLETLTLTHNSTKGKTYYYKVRSYNITEGVKVYSPFSSIKSIKSK